MRFIKAHPIPKALAASKTRPKRFVVLFWDHTGKTDLSATYDSMQEALEGAKSDETILSIIEIEI